MSLANFSERLSYLDKVPYQTVLLYKLTLFRAVRLLRGLHDYYYYCIYLFCHFESTFIANSQDSFGNTYKLK